MAINAPKRMSANMSNLLLEAAPSVPKPTFTPASNIACIGAQPEANFMLDAGLCATLMPRSAANATSSALVCTMCAAIKREFNTPKSSKRANGRLPCSFTELSTSKAVSWMWQWMSQSCLSASATTVRKVSSDTVYGACGAHANRTKSSPANSCASANDFSMYCAELCA